MSYTKRVRKEPKFSSPKLGDYDASRSAAERERMIEDQKIVAEFKSATYGDAAKIMRETVLSGGDVPAKVRSRAGALAAKTFMKPWRAQAQELSLQALEKFATLWPSLDLDDALTIRAPHFGIVDLIEGLTVSSYPCVLLKGTGRRDRYGALLPVFRKGKAVQEKSGLATALLLMRVLRVTGAVPSGGVDRNLVKVVDVMHGLVFVPPVHQKALTKDLESDAREIVDRWDSIGPRAA